MFEKILIANRGEIACRIIKTAKKLGISVVAIFSDIDAHALHVKLADEAYPLGGNELSDTYLNSKKIIAIAKQAGVEAIHPGYGFLSENADFAELCVQNGIVFVGPSSAAIQSMGDKVIAKKIMEEAGVPVTPGVHEETENIEKLKQLAKKIGFPILVKASAGGGGKGMRLVEKIDDLADAVTSAAREAESSFGNSKIFIEKYITQARHIEAQILFDQHGKGVFLFTRDCSIQRRHQKIIEEAPAIHLSTNTLKKIEKTALKAGKAIGYINAGTIEFLVDEKENFYFMEMNTRLQVEHPVTEMITHIDLIEWQLRIAVGESLSIGQSDLKIDGHAIELRLYAENPEENFMPSTGFLKYYQFPYGELTKLRIDTGFAEGDQISTFYDPLLAKIIVWAKDREAAIQTLRNYLKKIAIVGVKTNLNLLYRILSHPNFGADNLSTQFLEKHLSDLIRLEHKIPPEVIVFTSIALLNFKQIEKNRFTAQNKDNFSPWLLKDNWRLNQADASRFVIFFKEEKIFKVIVSVENGHFHFQWDNNHFIATSYSEEYPTITMQVHTREISHQISALIFQDLEEIFVFYEATIYSFSRIQTHLQAISSGLKDLVAPMTGKLMQMHVSVGQTVVKGEKLLVIEAMKMEHVLTASQPGKIKSICFQKGDRVNAGSLLLSFE